MSDRPQRTRLIQMLAQMDNPSLPKRALSEVLYTAQETGLIQEDCPLEDIDTLYKLLLLSQTITEVELSEIRM